MKIIQATRKCDTRLRTTVCSKVDYETKQNIENQDKVTNSVLSTNRCTNKIYEPRVGKIPEVLYRS